MYLELVILKIRLLRLIINKDCFEFVISTLYTSFYKDLILIKMMRNNTRFKLFNKTIYFKIKESRRWIKKD